MRRLALLWLIIVIVGALWLGAKLFAGFPLQTDILALLPDEQRDVSVRKATELVTQRVGKKVILVVSDKDGSVARAVATNLVTAIDATGLVDPVADALSFEKLKKVGAVYFPYRNKLLSAENRRILEEKGYAELSERSLAQVFGVGTIADANLLKTDPFLLFPAFIASLPFPETSLTLENGFLTSKRDDGTHVFIFANLRQEPYALDVQNRLIGAIDQSIAESQKTYPEVEVRRLGAIFFAAAASQQAINEASVLSIFSLLAITGIIVLVFRQIRPVFQNLLVVAVGVGGGTVASLWMFESIHIASLLFGVSLIGVSVDYGLYYTTSIFDQNADTPQQRLRKVMPGIGLGVVLTFIGYGALALAPFPGLRQIAFFSAIGLLCSCATVILWLPLLDARKVPAHRDKLLRVIERLATIWLSPRWKGAYIFIVLTGVIVLIAGAVRFHTEDDVRKLQALSEALTQQQQWINGLVGVNTANQFLLIQAADDETALQVGEHLEQVLLPLRGKAFASVQIPSGFVPSAKMQEYNHSLINELSRMEEYKLREALGIPPSDLLPEQGALSLQQALSGEGVPYLKELILEKGMHIVTFNGLSNPELVKEAIKELPVQFVDPVGKYSELFAKYRIRSTYLLVLFAAVACIILGIRYGIRRMWPVFLVPVIVVALTVSILALIGQAFTFFHVVGLILILVFTLDFAVFSAESRLQKRNVTLLSIWLAAITTLLSFGILSVSKVPAVQSFGSTMLTGFVLAIVLSPIVVKYFKS